MTATSEIEEMLFHCNTPQKGLFVLPARWEYYYSVLLCKRSNPRNSHDHFTSQTMFRIVLYFILLYNTYMDPEANIWAQEG